VEYGFGKEYAMPNVLRNHLNSHGPDAEALTLLARCWNQLEGNDLNAMAGDKVLRAENLKWNDPRLEFDIERHGGTALGSTRAEMQHWVVDLVARTVDCTTSGHRQLSPMRSPMPKEDMRRIAADLANKVATNADDPLLQWSAVNRPCTNCTVNQRASCEPDQGRPIAETQRSD
jgi:hypothetical protein